jgi:hypothetical protein
MKDFHPIGRGKWMGLRMIPANSVEEIMELAPEVIRQMQERKSKWRMIRKRIKKTFRKKPRRLLI